MRYISLGKIDKNSIPIFIGCIFSFLSRLLYSSDKTELFKHSIISNIVSAFARMLTIIPLIVLKIRSKRNHDSGSLNKNKNDVKLIYKNAKEDIIQGRGRYIILTSVIFFIQGIMLVYTIQVKTNFWILENIITCIFYYLIFKVKLFKHHYLSIILIILIGLILDLVFGNLQKDFSENFFMFVIRFFREILYSLHDVINKYVMEKKFCTPYELSFYNGLIGLILLSIFSVINYYYLEMDNFEEYLDNIDRTEILAIIGYAITQLGLYLFSLITNKKNTPCHKFIIYVFGQLAYYMDFSANSIVLIICVIFILFISLIFNEIIEINFWGLSDNTKRNIIKRGEFEDSNIDKIYTVDDFWDNNPDGEKNKKATELIVYNRDDEDES